MMSSLVFISPLTNLVLPHFQAYSNSPAEVDLKNTYLDKILNFRLLRNMIFAWQYPWKKYTWVDYETSDLSSISVNAKTFRNNKICPFYIQVYTVKVQNLTAITVFVITKGNRQCVCSMIYINENVMACYIYTIFMHRF